MVVFRGCQKCLKMVFLVIDCIRKKPGEPVLAVWACRRRVVRPVRVVGWGTRCSGVRGRCGPWWCPVVRVRAGPVHWFTAKTTVLQPKPLFYSQNHCFPGPDSQNHCFPGPDSQNPDFQPKPLIFRFFVSIGQDGSGSARDLWRFNVVFDRKNMKKWCFSCFSLFSQSSGFSVTFWHFFVFF